MKFVKIMSILTISTFIITMSNWGALAAESEGIIKRVIKTREYKAILGINTDSAYIENSQVSIEKPLLVLGKTYVDLYEIGNSLGIRVNWIEDEVGYFKTRFSRGYNGAVEKEIDFTLIYTYEDLKQPYKFFVRDSIIYVSLRELCEIAELSINYSDGVISVYKEMVTYLSEGYENEVKDKTALTSTEESNSIGFMLDVTDLNSSDDYIYGKYFIEPKHIVYPYEAYSYEYLVENSNDLQKMYPDIIKKSSIGKSVEGRDLILLEFGRGKKKIFVCGTHHAREYISTTYIMYAIDRYAYLYRTNGNFGEYNIKEILDNVTFCIVPMVNPDGVNLVQNGVYATQNPEYVKSMPINESPRHGFKAWKANINGVDVNWNYDKDWSIEKNKASRGSMGFNGDMPNSEPETIAMANYVDNHVFEAYISFHTQGSIFFWADDIKNPTNINRIVRSDTGFLQFTETGGGIGGSFFDYVYRKYGKATMTVELCKYVGNYPYPDYDFDSVWAPAKNILLIFGKSIMYR